MQQLPKQTCCPQLLHAHTYPQPHNFPKPDCLPLSQTGGCYKAYDDRYRCLELILEDAPSARQLLTQRVLQGGTPSPGRRRSS